MKQNITVKQLDALGKPKGLDTPAGKLIRWQWEHDIATQKKDGSWKLNVMSIGQMIEFLDDNRERSFVYDAGDGKTLELLVHWPTNKQLCDTLWYACKEILEH